VLLLAIAGAAAPSRAGSGIAPGSAYIRTNLVADLASLAPVVDPLLVNPWGAVARGTSPICVVNDGTSTIQLLRGDAGGEPFVPNASPSTITVPGGLPTGVVGNVTNAFAIEPAGGGTPAPASFVFVSITGNLTAWNAASGSSATVVRSLPGHVYTGLAIGANGGGSRLYAADFANRNIDVFDGAFASTAVLGGFNDATVPVAYHPHNVQNLGGSLYVTYARIGPDGRVENGTGAGYVRKFNTDGVRDLTFAINNGSLDGPWGLAIAPASFGIFGGALLVGNFAAGGGISAFNPTTGAFLGRLQDEAGVVLSIPWLRALQFGNGVDGGDANTVYFTSGIGSEEHGLVGSLRPTTATATSLLQFSAADVAISESAGFVDVSIARSGDSSGAATVDVGTWDQSQPGHASQKSDYELTIARVSFAPGETVRTVRVPLVNDGFVEGDEVVDLALFNPVGAGVGLGGPDTAELRILDDDVAPATENPIDAPAFFADQIYRDLLHRPAVEKELRPAVSKLERCKDATCTDGLRARIVQKLFASKAYQRTAVLAYVTNLTAFGPSALGSPAAVLYSVLERESQLIQQDGEDAYFDAIVRRPEFVAAYPTSLTPMQFVEGLGANAGITPRRKALKPFGESEGTSDLAARARALQSIATSRPLTKAQARPAFVALLYFSLLRRDPDTAGYNMALDELNGFGKALGSAQRKSLAPFLTRPEYRQRFGAS
jgi:uncharacterized protein (TIGR03118 family)